MSREKNNSSSGSGCLLRMLWIFAGPVAAFFALMSLFKGSAPFPALQDALFVLAITVTVVSRYADIRFFGGLTGSGDRPASLGDWRRHSITVVLCALAAWAVTRALV